MSLPTPITRKEQFLNSIAQGNTSDLPTPITREEEYLNAIAKSGGGSGDGDMKKSVYDSDLAVSEAGGIKAFVNSAVAGKVDKVEGKGLSTNDYDDTEKGKVADNTAAIEAIVNTTGSCNIMPNNAVTTTVWGVTFTVNSDKTIAVSGTPERRLVYIPMFEHYMLKAGTYVLSSGLPSSSYIFISLSRQSDSVEIAASTMSEDGNFEFTLNTDTEIKGAIGCYVPAELPSVSGVIKPMLYDVRLNPTGYVPYAMTNRELTDRVDRGYSGTVQTDGVKSYKELLNELFALTDRTKVTPDSKLIIDYTYVPLCETNANKSWFMFQSSTSSMAEGEQVHSYIVKSANSAHIIAYQGSEHDDSDYVLGAGSSLYIKY